jgi:hypothetical protein
MNKITFINRTTFPITIIYGGKKVKLIPNIIDTDDWLILPQGSVEIQIKVHLLGWFLKDRIETVQLDLDTQDTCYKISFDQESWEFIAQMNRLNISELITIFGIAVFGLSFLNKNFMEGIGLGYLLIMLVNHTYIVQKLKNYLKQKQQIISIEKSL